MRKILLQNLNKVGECEYDFQSKLCTCVSKVNFKTKFFIANNVFEIFKKNPELNLK